MFAVYTHFTYVTFVIATQDSCYVEGMNKAQIYWRTESDQSIEVCDVTGISTNIPGRRAGSCALVHKVQSSLCLQRGRVNKT